MRLTVILTLLLAITPTANAANTGGGSAPAPAPVATPTQSSAPSPSTKPVTAKKVTITCVKGKTVKKITAVKPTCPVGYKKK